MKQFDYSAQCEGGSAISGSVEAEDGAGALAQLTSMGLRNIDLQAARRPSLRRPLSSDDFIFFNEQLASLADSGICLDAGLRQLGRDVRSGRLRTVLDAVATDVERGEPLDKALERHAVELPALYARVVRAGVASGCLSATLLNLSHHLRMVAQTRRIVSEAVTYPAIVLVLAFGVLCAVISFVGPLFAEVLPDLGVRLPVVSRVTIALAAVMPQILAGVGVVALGLFILLLSSKLSPACRAACERLALGVPVSGVLIRDSLRTRFLRALSFAVNSGIPLPEAMRLSAGATASPAISKEAERVASDVERGTAVCQACSRTRLIPAMFGYVVDVSSDRGDLGDALVQLSKAYESSARHCQSLLRTWVAPLAVVAVGIVVGVLVLALFAPLAAMMYSI
ncbi:MAG: type II secretion system F family protein [Phycisphaerae bacterium]